MDAEARVDPVRGDEESPEYAVGRGVDLIVDASLAEFTRPAAVPGQRSVRKVR
jgi:hypothetical protein